VGEASSQLPLLVLLFGALVVATILIRSGLRRVGVPALVGHLALGLALRVLDEQTGVLGRQGHEVLGFLATIGVIVLLFRVGLESNLHGLVQQLRSASVVWLGNVAVSAAAGYLAARYLLSLGVIPSLVVATAMTATSVGIPAEIWRRAKALNSASGQRFLDVAELDDLSGVVLMALLFAVLPALRQPGEIDVVALVAGQAGLFAAKLVAFGGLCFLISRYAEQRLTRFLRHIESGPSPMLVVAGVGVLVAALAGLLGFSVAIGAFLAGLVFSRDPQSVKMDASFAPLHELFSPFFFIGIGLAMAPGSLVAATGTGAVLLLAAAAGKIIGTTAPALACGGRLEAVTLGVSMVPRAEIAMLIMHRGRDLGDWAVPPSTYAGMVLVSAATCVGAPVVLRHLLREKASRA
jgi:Kef-type K+ transport system membrane component KefB